MKRDSIILGCVLLLAALWLTLDVGITAMLLFHSLVSTRSNCLDRNQTVGTKG
jgi:hypothetical protein